LADLIRIGTRGSLLATTQAGVIRDALQAKGRAAELLIIATDGDRSDQPVADIGVDKVKRTKRLIKIMAGCLKDKKTVYRNNRLKNRKFYDQKTNKKILERLMNQR